MLCLWIKMLNIRNRVYVNIKVEAEDYILSDYETQTLGHGK